MEREVLVDELEEVELLVDEDAAEEVDEADELTDTLEEDEETEVGELLCEMLVED